MKKAFILAIILSGSSLFAETDAEKIADLEKRVSELEEIVKPIIAQQNTQAKREILCNKARERMRIDSKTYSRDELREIESLYQVANKKWGSDEGVKSLEQLISKYKKANRTGCAILYLGQMKRGDEQINYLKQAIDEFSDCYYGDGVQVGAYARFMLAGVYLQKGNKEEAMKLLEEIKTDYPDAIDHRGKSLADIINRELKKL